LIAKLDFERHFPVISKLKVSVAKHTFLKRKLCIGEKSAKMVSLYYLNGPLTKYLPLYFPTYICFDREWHGNCLSDKNGRKSSIESYAECIKPLRPCETGK